MASTRVTLEARSRAVSLAPPSIAIRVLQTVSTLDTYTADSSARANIFYDLFNDLNARLV
jgi:hypothetical protein